MGKFLGGLIVVCALAAGIGIYYLQVYAFYEPVPVTGTDDVQVTVMATGRPEPILYEDFKAIDADSSPIRYRACFTTQMSPGLLTETYQPYDRAVPLEAPGWFDCFDADEIGAALRDGRALAFMGTENIEYGIDRIVAVLPDGRGFVWHQINHCGEVVFDGQPVPENCPEPPESN
ncbi:DUF6446 family protein [Lutimaribacter sp. EGI FJ00015]|uniref:DUF6446 family protein n=1 Tax=Lutimaribacter degradans TaxID=2945989 RepID=A0ACC5ZRC7_9RHOB|nr:DUF6446 family protein [Lutimaribacter sp. EGI FJ00013]MCM2560710.1 DUF6446 family protein [Lutimaribacter sp. EGI FJ00013]MCO0612345.1 DUF6446 family protein [Lutimaribacter sp. EGI FJ00015]MCO0634535.1 DUF6446 family protein [Lutimaribacter sp. EGI FJ00014]